jgi:predicted nucleic acid-binding protein
VCWPVLSGFLRLDTSTRPWGARARTLASAWEAVRGFLELPAVRVVSPGEGHARIAGELLATPGLRSADVPDVEIAALAIEHGLVLASHDHGFRRFSGLRVVDPLTSAA